MGGWQSLKIIHFDMENQEQLIEMAQITTRAADIALSETLQQQQNERFKANENNTIPRGLTSNAPEWCISDLTDQVHYIGNYPLTHNSGEIVDYWTNRVPSWARIFTNIPFKLWLYYSFDVDFFFEFQSSPQVAGQYALAYCNMPFNFMDLCVGHPGKPNFFMRLPRKLITLGHNSNVKWTMNWNSPYSKLTQFDDASDKGEYKSLAYDMGTLFLICLNTVRKVETVNDPYVRVWASLTNLKYSGYYPQNQYIGAN